MSLAELVLIPLASSCGVLQTVREAGIIFFGGVWRQACLMHAVASPLVSHEHKKWGTGT